MRGLRGKCWITVVLVFCAAISGRARAEDYFFQTRTARLTLASNGKVTGLTDLVSGKERLGQAGRPFVSVTRGSQVFAATQMVRNGAIYHMTFGASGAAADYRITALPNYILVELTAYTGPSVDEIRLAQLSIDAPQHTGLFLHVLWNDAFSLCMMGLSQQVDSQESGESTWALVYPAYGMLGQKVAIIATPTSQFLNVVQTVERDFNLPSPKIGGIWAKSSLDVKTSYLFTDLTESNVDEMIRYAKLAGMRYILINDETWSASEGLYPINRHNYPHGEAGLQQVIAKCHAAGLKVGMHMMTSLVGKTDPMVRPVPSQGLLTDGETTLATAVDAQLSDLPVTGQIPAPSNPADPGDSHDFWIEDEVVHCEEVSENRLARCVRGYSGTTAGIHRTGAAIRRLVQQDNRYLVDLRSPLANTLSARIDDLVNRLGFDMIYFDAGELNKVEGPYWYWVGVQQMKIWQGLHRDVLMQGSGATNWTWHLFARGTCEDFAAVAVKDYMDEEKIAVALRLYQDAFVPAELGWTALLSETPDHPATTPDEMEHNFVRMLALGVPESIQTTEADLKANGRSDEMLAMMGQFERLRLSGAVPANVRAKLATGEWHMTHPGEFNPIRHEDVDIPTPGKTELANRFESQSLKFKLQVAPNLTAPEALNSIVLFRRQSPEEIPAPNAQEKIPGALALHVPATMALTETTPPGSTSAKSAPTQQTFDLRSHRAISATLDVEGPVGVAHPVLNIQLQDISGAFRNYYVPLDFRGEKTIVVRRPQTEDMLAEFRPAVENYRFKRALYTFNYDKVTGVNVRWARYDRSSKLRCALKSVVALNEQSSTLSNVTISIGDSMIAIPGTLRTGDYAEYWGDVQMHIFDHNGVLQRTVFVHDTPLVNTGENTIHVSASNPGDVRFTLITMGN